MADALELHYVDTVLHIQKLILRRTPRLLSRAVGLTPTEVEQIARLLAEAHTVAGAQDTVGICGEQLPASLGCPTDVCELPSGHAGWHHSAHGTEWGVRAG